MWKNTIYKHPIILLSLLFIAVNAALYTKLGVVVDSDTERFLQYAEEIKTNGVFFKPHDFWYIGYALFILAANSIWESLMAVVLAQATVSYLALMAIYHTALKLYRSQAPAILSGLLFLGFFKISYWNFWIYAESLLISLTCISFYLVVRWQQGERSIPFTMLAVLVIGYTFFVKPTGVAFLAGIVAMIIPYVWNTLKHPFSRTTGFTVIFLLFFYLLNQMLATFGFIRDYATGEIVYNITKMAHMDYAKWLMVTPPKNLYLPDENEAALLKAAKLVLGNPIYALQLFSLKAFYFLGYIRPYYSAVHNLAALSILLPCYIAFTKTLGTEKIALSLRLFAGSFVLVSLLSCAMLTVDWDSRFLMVVLPIVFLFALGTLVNWLPSRILLKLEKRV
ncbi:hypothetical protein [Lunatibacter salilacus]|uniref:hypothetical protein n=1 Tax=Lunatibacter salilacus TaxID=2483804 RepID=UPI00131E9435|nr:hypothetical protein [Lunatibacter salilacus]